MDNKTLITSLQRFSVNDGPGFRTNVFLKGCPLKCKWCHNPETQSFRPEIYWKKRSCVQCGACYDACPEEAIRLPISYEQATAENSDYYKIYYGKCNFCMKCVDICKYSALEKVGEPLSIKEIIEEVEKDRLFYNNSNGGLTISGGEPLAHSEFSLSLLDAAIENDLHVCVDTSGFGKWEVLEQFAEKADIILFDIKHINPQIHKTITGVENDTILENLKRLSQTDTEIWIRILVIPGYSDTADYHKQLSGFLKNLPRKIDRIDILPYHNWCEDKYSWLGKTWEMGDVEAIDTFDIDPFIDFYQDTALSVTIGGSGFEEVEKIET